MISMRFLISSAKRIGISHKGQYRWTFARDGHYLFSPILNIIQTTHEFLVSLILGDKIRNRDLNAPDFPKVCLIHSLLGGKEEVNVP